MNSVKRLYRQFHPVSYKIEINPNLKTETFTGKIIISGIKIGPSSSRITLHQLGLKITSSKIIFHSRVEDQILDIKRLNYHQKYNELRIHFDSKIRSGRYTIELGFKGKMTKDLTGMYISQYKIGSQTKKIITTQFESHSAREVFPCIDEPEAKATFDLTVIHPSHQIVLSNTPILKDSKLSKTEIKTTFTTTPIMSTYLLAFIIGDLKFKESKTENGTVIRSYATADKIDYVDFSLEIATKCIDFYNQYFDIPYPLEKCDLIALPDFTNGAMENWGCITFREQAMLVDPKRSSLHNKQMVALVIAHELSHQWFGNLVTMKWWTDLWLNEGFATWMEYFAIDSLFPDWGLWIQFIVDEQQIALNLDSLENTHPIEVKVNHPDEIRTIFDSISYSKGASVIHMLYKFVGPDNFRLGLHNYLKKFSYKNTDTNDLWDAIGSVANKPVNNFMSSWTVLKGFPVVECRVSKSAVNINQKRFDYQVDSSNDGSLWPIALISNNSNLPEIFDQRTDTYQGSYETVKLNNDQTGFYRVVCDNNNLQRLGKLVQAGKINDADRLGLLSDLLETSKANFVDITTILKFIEFYNKETNYAVWDVIALTLSNIKYIICDEALKEKMKPFIRDLIANEIDRLGMKPKTNENHFDTLLRPIILGLAASSGVKSVIDFCHQQFKILTSHNPKAINPDFKSFVLNTIAKEGDHKDYDQMIKMHNESNLSEERTTLIAAITIFKQPELIDKTLKFIKSSDVRSQDISYWVAYSFGNRFAKDKTWEWLKQNWKWLEDTLGTDLSFFRMPIYVARAFNEEKSLREYCDFFERRLTPSFDRTYRQGLEIINIQATWKQRSFDKLDKFIDDYKSSK